MSSEQINNKKTRGLTCQALKVIAVISMLIDHTGYSLVYHLPGISDHSSAIYVIYMTMRIVGRCAFPIYCFLIVEGLMHTRSVPKYLLRLSVFALISEVPFNLAFYGVPFEWSHQNVFFTLALGLLMLWGFEAAQKHVQNQDAIITLDILMLIAASVAAYFMHTDYKYAGTVTIAIMYVLRKEPVKSILSGCIALTALSSALEIFALADIPLIRSYNGLRGRGPKYLYYMIYPVHLMLLYLIGTALGMHGSYIL